MGDYTKDKYSIIANKMLKTISNDVDGFMKILDELNKKDEEVRKIVFAKFEDLVCGSKDETVKVYAVTVGRFNNKKILSSMQLETVNSHYCTEFLIDNLL